MSRRYFRCTVVSTLPSDRKAEIKWADGDEDFSSEIVPEQSVRFVKEFVPLQLAQAKRKADILVVDRLEDSSAPSLWLATIVQLEHSLLKTRKPSVAVRYRNQMWAETWVPLHACYQLIPRRNRLAATEIKLPISTASVAPSQVEQKSGSPEQWHFTDYRSRGSTSEAEKVRIMSTALARLAQSEETPSVAAKTSPLSVSEAQSFDREANSAVFGSQSSSSSSSMESAASNEPGLPSSDPITQFFCTCAECDAWRYNQFHAPLAPINSSSSFPMNDESTTAAPSIDSASAAFSDSVDSVEPVHNVGSIASSSLSLGGTLSSSSEASSVWNASSFAAPDFASALQDQPLSSTATFLSLGNSPSSMQDTAESHQIAPAKSSFRLKEQDEQSSSEESSDSDVVEVVSSKRTKRSWYGHSEGRKEAPSEQLPPKIDSAGRSMPIVCGNNFGLNPPRQRPIYRVRTSQTRRRWRKQSTPHRAPIRPLSPRPERGHPDFQDVGEDSDEYEGEQAEEDLGSTRKAQRTARAERPENIATEEQTSQYWSAESTRLAKLNLDSARFAEPVSIDQLKRSVSEFRRAMSFPQQLRLACCVCGENKPASEVAELRLPKAPFSARIVRQLCISVCLSDLFIFSL